MKKITTEWKLSDLGKSLSDTKFIQERKELEKKSKAFARKWKKNKDFLSKPKVLQKALEEYSQLIMYGNSEDLFLWLHLQKNSSDTQLQAAMKKFEEFVRGISEYSRFFLLELAEVDKASQKKMLAAKELNTYRHFLETLFAQSRYQLSEAEEKILSFKSGVSHGNWEAMLEEFLFSETRKVLVKKKGGYSEKELGLASIAQLNASSCGRVRSSSRKALIDILTQYKKVAEKEINSILENKKIDDELRSYARPDSSRHIHEDIDTEIVDTLRRVVADNYRISQDFHTFKLQLLKKKKFNYEERSLGYGKFQKKYSYTDAVDIVRKAFARIDQSFVDIFDDFVAEGKIDVYPQKGKRGGAFCISHGLHLPVYVMLNFTESARDIATLAHEMGHAVHGVLSKKEAALNYGHPMCTAEVASTFCEDFVFEELLHDVTEQERLVMMVNKLQDRIQTIFRQIAAYNFEFELHTEFRKKGYLSCEEIGVLFNKHMKAYLGPSFSLDEHSALGWISWSHFRSPFYVYSYAMGLISAQAMQAKFREDPEFITLIKEFYTTGTSRAPVDIFKRMGFDIRKADFWQQGLDETKALLQETKKLAKTLGKI